VCSIHQEDRLKHFKQQLEQVLESFYSIQEAVDPAIRPLMAPHIEAVVRYVCNGSNSLIPRPPLLVWELGQIAKIRELSSVVPRFFWLNVHTSVG